MLEVASSSCPDDNSWDATRNTSDCIGIFTRGKKFNLQYHTVLPKRKRQERRFLFRRHFGRASGKDATLPAKHDSCPGDCRLSAGWKRKPRKHSREAGKTNPAFPRSRQRFTPGAAQGTPPPHLWRRRRPATGDTHPATQDGVSTRASGRQAPRLPHGPHGQAHARLPLSRPPPALTRAG